MSILSAAIRIRDFSSGCLRNAGLVSLVFLLHLWPATVSAQYVKERFNVTRTLTSADLDEVQGRAIWSDLSYAFNVSLQRMSVEINGQLDVVLSGRGETTQLTMVWNPGRFNVSISFEGFSADSILLPDKGLAFIDVYNGNHLRTTLEIGFRLAGDHVQLMTDELAHAIGAVRLQLREIRWVYTPEQVQQVHHWIRLVHDYYSWSALTSEMMTHWDKESTSGPLLLVQDIEVQRAQQLFEESGLVLNLHLEDHDPAGLLGQWRKLRRLATRNRTLLEGALNEEGPEKGEWLHAFPAFWHEHVNRIHDELETQKPAESTAFDQMLDLSTGPATAVKIKEELRKTVSLTDVEVLKTGQPLVDDYVSMAVDQVNHNEYSHALTFLDNARLLSDVFDAAVPGQYHTTFLQAFDGVAGSYLAVAVRARKAGNVQMQKKYVDQAEQLAVDLHLAMSSLESHTAAMPATFDALLDLCALDGQANHEAILMKLEKWRPLVIKLHRSGLPALDSLGELHAGVMITMLTDSSYQLIREGQYPDAYELFTHTASVSSRWRAFMPDSSSTMGMVASSLARIYYRQSMILVKADQAIVALEELERAQSLADYLPLPLADSIEQGISAISEPVISAYLKKAGFESWAYHMENAMQWYLKADSLADKYLLNRSSMLWSQLDSTESLIKGRKCQKMQNQLSVLAREIKAGVSNKNPESILRAYMQGNMLIGEYPDCDPAGAGWNEAESVASPLMVFEERKQHLNSMLFEKGYEEVVNEYLSIQEWVQTNELETLGLYWPGVTTFVSVQQLPLLTLATAEYYMKKKDWDKALVILDLARSQKLDPAKAKPVMRALAEGLATRDKENDVPVGEALLSYTEGQKWYNWFAIWYRKYRAF